MRFVSLALIASLGTLAGCGSAATSTEHYVCQPACPTGTHCDRQGCLPDSDDAGVTQPDLSMTTSGCQPACGGATPICNPKGNCVGCGADGDCPAGQVCHVVGDSSAFCVPGCTSDERCRAAGGSPTAWCCGGQCVEVASDVLNCGACGTVCASQHAAATCQAGACAAGACDPGWGDCNRDASDGCEVKVSVDATHCGACGVVCSLANAVSACSTGCYIASCKFGWDDCDSNSVNGCETSVLSDAKNCGACGLQCKGLPNAQSVCNNGGCEVSSCNKNFGNCDGISANGCETALAANAKNCGACGVVCDPGLVCKAGSCTCPQCDNVFPNASASCMNNQCAFDKCNPGWFDCDGDLKNGCESDVTADVKNCGACNNVCPNNQPVCINSACTNIDLSDVFKDFQSEGRNVYIWKTPGACVDLAKYKDFCTDRGLAWWTPRSANDAQMLIDTAANLDKMPTWIQIYGLVTTIGKRASMGGFTVQVDSPDCEEASPGGDQFGAIRRWGCSVCNPPSNIRDQNDNQGCCWDKGNPYDWFVCED